MLLSENLGGFPGSALNRYVISVAVDLPPAAYETIPDQGTATEPSFQEFCPDAWRVRSSYKPPDPELIQRRDVFLASSQDHSDLPQAVVDELMEAPPPEESQLAGVDEGRFVAASREVRDLCPGISFIGFCWPFEVRVRLCGSAKPYLQLTWGDGGSESIALRGLEAAKSKGEIDDLLGGIRVLCAVARKGRPRLEDSDDSGWLALVQKAEKFKRQNPTVAWNQVAARFNLTVRTLARYRERLRALRRNSDHS